MREKKKKKKKKKRALERRLCAYPLFVSSRRNKSALARTFMMGNWKCIFKCLFSFSPINEVKICVFVLSISFATLSSVKTRFFLSECARVRVRACVCVRACVRVCVRVGRAAHVPLLIRIRIRIHIPGVLSRARIVERIVFHHARFDDARRDDDDDDDGFFRGGERRRRRRTSSERR